MKDEVDLHNLLRDSGLGYGLHWSALPTPYQYKLIAIAEEMGADVERLEELEQENEDLAHKVTQQDDLILSLESELRDTKKALDGVRSQVVLLIADRDRQGTEV